MPIWTFLFFIRVIGTVAMLGKEITRTDRRDRSGGSEKKKPAPE
nr:hypothetical protein [Azospirillum sp. 412522]